jgi:hypothetical protein
MVSDTSDGMNSCGLRFDIFQLTCGPAPLLIGQKYAAALSPPGRSHLRHRNPESSWVDWTMRFGSRTVRLSSRTHLYRRQSDLSQEVDPFVSQLFPQSTPNNDFYAWS